MTLDDLNSIPIPPYPPYVNTCFGQKGYGRDIRIKCYLEMLTALEPLTTAEEALYIVNETIEHVEDLYSGLERETIVSPKMKTERMYKALEDYITPKSGGGYTIKTKGNRIEINPNGTFSIFHRESNELWLKKNGK